MSGSVNLLLLLSALLSALAGGGVSARTMQPAQAVASAAKEALPATRTAARRPVQPLATRAASAVAPRAQVWRLDAAVPLFAGRRRE